MTEPPRKILVTGATGKQGGSVIKGLLAHPPSYNYKILALTRNVDSPSAKSLAQNSSVEVVAGDFDDCDAVFEKAGGHGSVWGVFLVTLPAMSKKNPSAEEEKQGKAVVDAAKKYGVKSFVFSSVDRGGEKSDQTPTAIPHFISKHNIENHLKDQFKDTDVTWTILRPVCFMDNANAGMFGKVFNAMFMNMGVDTKLQFVASSDIGTYAAQAFRDPGSETYGRKALSLAGEEMSFNQANETFWKVYGRPLPRTYWFMGSLLQTFIKEVGVMFRWFVTDGYGADIALCKKLNPEIKDFEAFLRQEGKFATW